MKLFRNAAILANGLLLAAIFGACQHENETGLFPQSKTVVTDRNAKTGLAPQLIKDGSKVLEYSTNALGRKFLTKITDEISNQYFTFTYSSQSIQVKNYDNTNKLLTEYAYKLDANGRCIESTFGNKVYGFEYNAKGQLSKRFSKVDVNERTEFVYSVFSNNKEALHKILFYNKYNSKTREIIYNYGTTPDLSLINPESFFEITAQHLAIFGKFSENLPSMIFDETGTAYNKTTQNWILDYTLNADGYVKTVGKKIQGANTASVVERKYLSPLAQ